MGYGIQPPPLWVLWLAGALLLLAAVALTIAEAIG